jgi:hypothetical protein
VRHHGRLSWLGITVLLTMIVSSCGGPPTATTARSQATVTTQLPSTTPTDGATSAVGSPHCLSGTATVDVPTPEPATVCVKVGSTLVMTGGDAMSGGTWPGPPNISDRRVLNLMSSHSRGTSFNATLKAIQPGTSSIDVPFVAGPDVCNPTPCTPVPGAPILLQVTVIS